MFLKEYGKAKAKILRIADLEPSHNTYPDVNGEYSLLKLLASLPEIRAYDTIIDVGSHRGDWTAAAIHYLAAHGICKYYCVEPIPTFNEVIKDRFVRSEHVTLIDLVFSHSPGGEVEIFEIGGGGRLYQNYNCRGKNSERPVAKRVVSHKIPVSTGDDVFGSLAIKPYLVKIDCDGHDLHVLHGFARTLREKRPLVQFEYSDFWIGAGSRLRDACRLLADAGYDTFKMFPDRLERFRFRRLFETFGYQNIFSAPREFRSFSGKTIPLPKS